MQKIFKTIATAYMISGDMNGYYGKKEMNYVKIAYNREVI